jgi:ferredoxin
MDIIDVLNLSLRVFDVRLPEVDRTRCVATRYQGSSCRRCLEVCPGAALAPSPSLDVDPERCVGCGACAAVCPTGALDFAEPRAALRAELRAAGRKPEATFTIGCRRALLASDDGSAALRVECLGALNAADFLAAWYAGVRRLGLVSAACDECSLKPAVTELTAAMQATRVLLAAAGQWLVLRRLTVASSESCSGGAAVVNGDHGADDEPTTAALVGHQAREAGLSRRDLFTFFGARSAHLVSRALAGRKTTVNALHAAVGPAPIHEVLVAHLDKVAADHDGLTVPTEVFHVASLAFSARCNGCGLCERYCPHGAIVVTEMIALADARLCTGCGLCVEVCPQAAIELRAAELPLIGFPPGTTARAGTVAPPAEFASRRNSDVAMRAAARRATAVAPLPSEKR